jgi:hypothetical protein
LCIGDLGIFGITSQLSGLVQHIQVHLAVSTILRPNEVQSLTMLSMMVR